MNEVIRCYGISAFDSNAMKSAKVMITLNGTEVHGGVCGKKQNGSKAMGIGWQEERAATLRVADMGAVLVRIRRSEDTMVDAQVAENISKVGKGEETVWTTSKGSYMTEWIKGTVKTLVATDYKDPPIVMTMRCGD